MIRLTYKMLSGWGGAEVFREAEAIVQRGSVKRAEVDGDWIRGGISRGTHDLKTALRVLPSGTVESHCPCWANREQGRVCSHVVALGLCVARRQHDPRREQKYQAEQRRAKRLAALDPGRYLRRATADTPNAHPAAIELTLPRDWRAQLDRHALVRFTCAIRVNGSRLLTPEQAAGGPPLRFGPGDDALLYVLEDICEGPARAEIPTAPVDFHNVLELRRGHRIRLDPKGELRIEKAPAQTPLRVELDEVSGHLRLRLGCTLEGRPEPDALFVVHGQKGWVSIAERLHPLAVVLPLPYQALYLNPVEIPRAQLLAFAKRELPLLEKLLPTESEFDPTLLNVEADQPVFTLVLKGSPASLAASLYAEYGDARVPAGASVNEEALARPDPEDPLRYFVRNLSAESHAIDRLARLGFQVLTGEEIEPLTGSRNVLNVVGAGVAALRREGWRIRFEGRIAETAETLGMVVPVVQIAETEQGRAFDVDFNFESPAGESLANASIQRALRRGEYYLEHQGQSLLLDADAIEAMQAVFRDAGSREGGRPGTFRMNAVHAAYVAASLEALDGIDIEQPPDWRARCARQNRSREAEPVCLPETLDKILRPYQKSGVEWLRMLEVQGFAGILADEMGLGKTLQTLAWLQLPRVDAAARDLPALIICPTSLVENWAREAQTFVPSLKVLILSGNRRHDLWTEIPAHDMVISSYALLRRDLPHYLAQRFGVVVLDEAQHIKNRSTQNALAAKKLPTHHRLVLTGTPVENAVSDLWSIMDFLMPGYLGDYETFRTFYEQPTARDDVEGEQARKRLRRKLHPFMLRRLKRDVARDLPPKLEKVSYCSLSRAQAQAYNALLDQSRRQIGNLVAEQGFDRSRMQILAVLMRLRQVCCHLDLLKKPPAGALTPAARQAGGAADDSLFVGLPDGRVNAAFADEAAELAEPGDNGLLPGAEALSRKSAKTVHFLELLDEAIDGGHRMLVFSQFVSMLRILKGELRQRGIAFAYLDGSTKNRLAEVRRFNRDHDLPVFLISLKAGGTGLNLTGADMVVHFDPWWNPAVEAQATDRAHRIGQQRTVYSVKLIAEHTIEEKVLALQARKRALIEDTVERREGPPPTALSWQDIQELLSL